MSDLIDRQAVIDLLKQMRKDGNMVPWEGKDVFARIRKLPTIQPEKAQLSQEGTTSDLISRQAVIDAIVQCTNCGDEDTLREYVLKHSLDNGWTGGILEALDAVKDLPSVQPEPHEGHWIEVAGELECSECHTVFTDLYPDYADSVACPHCGARMKGE